MEILNGTFWHRWNANESIYVSCSYLTPQRLTGHWVEEFLSAEFLKPCLHYENDYNQVDVKFNWQTISKTRCFNSYYMYCCFSYEPYLESNFWFENFACWYYGKTIILKIVLFGRIVRYWKTLFCMFELFFFPCLHIYGIHCLQLFIKSALIARVALIEENVFLCKFCISFH